MDVPTAQASAKITGHVDSTPDWPMEDSRTAFKADPDAPIAKAATARGEWLGKESKADPDSPIAKPAATRGGWLSGGRSHRLSTIIWGGMAGLALFWCVRHGLPAHEPSYPLFDLGNWDEMQRDMNSLHSMVQSERFSSSEQIQASVEQSQNSMRRCRYLTEDASTDLGTVVMRRIQDWVFGGKCTSALPVVVRRSHEKTQSAVDCANNITSTLTTAMHQIQEAQSNDNKIITTIVARHSSPTKRQSPEQVAKDDESLDATRKSLSHLTSIQSHLMVVHESYRPEHKRLIRLNEDMGRLEYFFHRPQKGVITPEGSMQEGNHTSTWVCQDFDIPGLRDTFSSLALTVIGDDEKIRQFQSHYYLTSPDPNA